MLPDGKRARQSLDAPSPAMCSHLAVFIGLMAVSIAEISEDAGLYRVAFLLNEAAAEVKIALDDLPET